ncbi:hypothetical protein TSTA_071290 [Talaromyces stipitatus ATCC 10500]|uniref:Uncharacterized protein n=1 Tax=Talaromyces stipitatus (strain ATCC 10500 / CBS 375.48 / QM 6759 / NRRL 1006) TaxID=441959 RepID=B8LUF7_TALSN|nr:uncharacterized protein TSTA_071290 [Talaromyces stipitatus ATCC 10500]EED23730.1 hypothetical protein TSTA_071290 [Talaromyces stipitatus ATCC 10500]
MPVLTWGMKEGKGVYVTDEGERWRLYNEGYLLNRSSFDNAFAHGQILIPYLTANGSRCQRQPTSQRRLKATSQENYLMQLKRCKEDKIVKLGTKRSGLEEGESGPRVLTKQEMASPRDWNVARVASKL